MSVVVSAFYKFVRIEQPPILRERLFAALSARGMKGTVLVAPEGINGTISGTRRHMAEFLALLRADAPFADLVTKDATTDAHPFKRLKVRLKREIITLNAPEADPTVRVGTYVAPQDWNALISDPDVLVVDTRNGYEVAAGTFQRAIDPQTRSFGEWPAFVERALAEQKQRRIAMFCTGGIRCEKASAHLLAHGFDQVYQLQGGILNYLQKVPADQSLWQGRCFVFDERETIDAINAPPSIP